MKVEISEFTNKKDMVVRGLRFSPDPGNNDVGIMYLPGSVIGLTAVHRLGIKVCERFAGKGVISYVFDHSGVGESEGPSIGGNSVTIGNFVKTGGLLEDTLEAIDHFRRTSGIKKLILIGHCGGALSAVYAAAKTDGVNGLVLISPPLFGEENDPAGMSAGATDEYFGLYKSKIFSFQAWRKLFSGKTDYRQLCKVISRKFTSRKNSVEETLNRDFISAFQSIREKMPILFLMGDRDTGIPEFEAFCAKYIHKNNRKVYLKDTSHGFVTEESLSMLYEELSVFLGAC